MAWGAWQKLRWFKVGLVVIAFFALLATGWVQFILATNRWHPRLSFSVVACSTRGTDGNCARSLICRYLVLLIHYEGLDILQSAFIHMVLMWFTQQLLKIQTRLGLLLSPTLHKGNRCVWTSVSLALSVYFADFLIVDTNGETLWLISHRIWGQLEERILTPVEYYWVTNQGAVRSLVVWAV